MRLKTRYNRIIFFFIVLFGGPFGIHWFLLKKYLNGFIYFFTVGVFGFGWLYDTYRAFVSIFKEESLFTKYTYQYDLALHKKQMDNKDVLTNFDKYESISITHSNQTNHANYKPNESKKIVINAAPEMKTQENKIEEQTVLAQQPEKTRVTHKIQDYTFKVAGISYREKDIIDNILENNSDFEMTKKEIIDASMEDERIYQYDYWSKNVQLIDEPDNEYDSKAIAIYADGTKIGYVKKGSTSRIRNLLKKEVKQISITIQGGKYKYVKYDLDDDSYEMYRDKVPLFARLTIDVREPINKGFEK